MKNIITFLLIIGMAQFSFGQQQSIDSLQSVLNKLESDTAKIVVLIELAMKTNMSEPEASNKYGLQALQIAEANNYFVHIIDTYTVLAASNDELGNFNTSLEYLHKIMDIFEEEGNNEQIAVTNFQIATAHLRRGDDDLSLEYLSKVVEHKSELTDSLLIAHVYSMLGNINLNKENYENAKTYLKKASDIYEEKNNTYGINYVRNGYARLYEKTGQYEIAIVEYEKVVEYCRITNNNNCICHVLNHLGDVYRKQKLFEKARGYYLQSLETASQYGMKDSEMDSYLLLFELDSLEGNYKSALHNFVSYSKIKDSLFTQGKEKNISELHIKYESEQKANDIISLQETEKRKNEMIIVISIIILLLIFALVFHWRMLRIKHKSNVQLENNNKVINEQKNEISKIADELSSTNDEIKAINIKLSKKNLELTKSLEEINRIQKQLIHAEKMASIGVLTAGIAHEINNPVNFIQGGVNSVVRDFKDIESVLYEATKINLETDNLKEKLLQIRKLKMDYGFDEALESIPEILKDIKLGAERTTAIVKSLGAFARSDDDFRLFNIHESIETSLILLRNKYKENIEIIKIFDDDIPKIKCNPSKANQIFLNLLSNAIDAISEKGKIYITTKLLDNMISISVKDTGAGIKKELQNKIFDPFYTSKPEGEGIGLGLYIVYGLIQEHNGSIELISGVGKGSEFIVYLPLA